MVANAGNPSSVEAVVEVLLAPTVGTVAVVVSRPLEPRPHPAAATGTTSIAAAIRGRGDACCARVVQAAAPWRNLSRRGRTECMEMIQDALRTVEGFADGFCDARALESARQAAKDAFYITDAIKLGRLTVNVGLRDDQYNGLSSANGVQPRLGISYLIPRSKTVVRAAYARTFETPFNENLILSSGTGGGGL